MEDEGGVLGNLPRSRPGKRSQKRPSGKGAKQAPSKPRRPAATKRSAGTAARRAPRAPTQQPSADDPMGDAMRLATQVPLIGVRVAAGVTRELLRRMPRP